MKKTIVLSLALLFTAIFNYSSGRGVSDTLTAVEPAHVTTLIINANVNVVLVDNDKATLEVAGGKSLTELVTFKKTGDTLVINSLRNRDFKNAGTIYVPAGGLRKILVNSSAQVRSLNILQISKLDVVINGTCKINISNVGELNFIETNDFYFDQTREVYKFPPSILLNKKY